MRAAADDGINVRLRDYANLRAPVTAVIDVSHLSDEELAALERENWAAVWADDETGGEG
jgi:hypothetical protein